MKHNSHLVMGFIRSSSSTGVTQEKISPGLNFSSLFSLSFFLVSLYLTQITRYR